MYYKITGESKWRRIKYQSFCDDPTLQRLMRLGQLTIKMPQPSAAQAAQRRAWQRKGQLTSIITQLKYLQQHSNNMESYDNLTRALHHLERITHV